MFKEIFHEKKRKLLFLLSIFIIVTLAISMINSASAADIIIKPNTLGGFEKAVETANNGDTIYLKDGVYKGKRNTEINIEKNISITGLGSKIVLDGQGKNYLISIQNNNKVSLKKLNFKNGYDKNFSGAAIYSKGRLTVNSCTFTNNKALTGGAIYSEGKLTVSSCTFTNNKAKFGGAIDSRRSFTVSKSTFTNNQVPKKEDFYGVRYGGAFYSEGKLTVNSCTFNNNKAPSGGAIFSYGSSTMSESTFTNNKAIEYGGAICNENQPMKIVNSKFTNNIVGKNYNAIDYFYKKPYLKNVKITPKEGSKVKTIWLNYLS
jgi:predicted outer membrane repeat protein